MVNYSRETVRWNRFTFTQRIFLLSYYALSETAINCIRARNDDDDDDGGHVSEWNANFARKELRPVIRILVARRRVVGT